MTSTCRCARALDACGHRFACCVAGALLGVALQGCWPGDRADAVVIPQSTAPLTPDESRWTIGLDYRPTDLPLAWLPDDSILVWHEESYAKFDVGGGTCAGSGLAYLEDESTSGGGAIRVVDSDGGADHVVFRNRIFTSFSNGWRRIRDGNPAGPFVWGPGGRVLLFTRHYARGNSIWGLDLETGRVSQITAPATPRRRPTS